MIARLTSQELREPTQQKGPSPPQRCLPTSFNWWMDGTFQRGSFMGSCLKLAKTWGDISWRISGCMVAGDGKWRWAEGAIRHQRQYTCGTCLMVLVYCLVCQSRVVHLDFKSQKAWALFCSHLIHISLCFNGSRVLLYPVSSNHSTYHQLTSPQVMVCDVSVQIDFPFFPYFRLYWIIICMDCSRDFRQVGTVHSSWRLPVYFRPQQLGTDDFQFLLKSRYRYRKN